MQIESRFRLIAGILAACCWSCSHDSPTQPPFKHWPVRGTIEDRLGAPIASANLKFHNDKDSAKTISDNRGWFEVQLMAGDYFFIASSGIGFNYWGTRRWEIISSSVASNRIIYVVRIDASGKQTRTYPGPLPPPFDTTEYAYSDSFDVNESDGQITLGACTTLKHFMQPGDKIASRDINACDSSRVSTGAPIIVNGLQIETLKIDAVGFPLSERTWVAVQIGIVMREVQLRGGNTNRSERLRLHRYFIQKVGI